MKFTKSILIALTSLLLITSCDKSSPNGGNPTEEDTGIYLKINEEIDRNNMLHKTKYKDTNIDTYVLGYMSFNPGDIVSIYSNQENTQYGYNNLLFDISYTPNHIEFNKNGIEINTNRKIGIEFNRNKDKLIRLYFINDPFPDPIEDFVNDHISRLDINNREEVRYFDRVYEYTKDSEEYKEFTWFMNNPYIQNCDRNLSYLQTKKDIEYLHMSFEYKGYFSYIEPSITYQDFNEHNMLIITNNIEYASPNLILKSFEKANITFKYFPLINMCYIEAIEMR